MAWGEQKDVATMKSDGAAFARSESSALVGQSLRMLRLGRLVSKIAHRRHPVLLLGETGTGKETLARLIHTQGPNAERPFVAVDCSAATASLFEPDNVFRGRVTGSAGKSRERIFDSAGTIFLSEIWTLTPELQSRLVRLLQEREIRPLTDGKALSEARIIAASSRDLELAVQQGTFRRDLYVRLNLSCVRIPPLRDRKEDINSLADHFLAAITTPKATRRTLSPDARTALLSYDWPGNVRELKACIEQAANSAAGPVLEVADLPTHLEASAPASANRRITAVSANIVPLAEVERQTILQALERLNGDKLMTARALGIGKTTLYRKLKEYGLCAPFMGRSVSHR